MHTHGTCGISLPNVCYFIISDALQDLVPFVQFKKREKTHGGVLLLVKPTTLLKVTLLHGCFLRFLNFTNGTNSRKTSHFIRKESYSSSQFNMTDSFAKILQKFLYWKFVINF